MANNAQQNAQRIVLALKAELEAKFTNAAINRGLKAARDKVVQIVRDRTSRGIDVNGKRFPKLSKNYRKWKLRYAKGRVSGRTKRRLGDTTGFRAKGVPNHIRLTGKTFSDMTATTSFLKSDKLNFSVGIKFFVKKRSAKKVDWLRDMKRDFFGLSTKKAAREKEEKQIYAAFIAASGIPALVKDIKIKSTGK